MPAEFRKVYRLKSYKLHEHLRLFGRYFNRHKRIVGYTQKKIAISSEKLDEENLAISLDKCRFSCKQVEWLGFTVNSEGTKPLVKKTEAIEKLSPPKFYVFHTSSHTVHSKISTNRCRITPIAKKHREEQTT